MASFLPWMGSKRLLVKQLLARTPANYQRYFEPFLGSGALLYALQPAEAFATDELRWVIDLHRAVGHDMDELESGYRALSLRTDRKQAFLEVRSRFPSIEPHEFFFMIKHCHGSRFRVNKSGGFNTPYNASTTKPSTNSERSIDNDIHKMRAVSHFAKTVSFECGDYADLLSKVRGGDLVFLDPPYRWDDREADYGGTWNIADWRRLITLLSQLPNGVHIMLTMHGSMPFAELEAIKARVPGMRLEALELPGSLLKEGGRQARTEWLAVNY